MIGHILGDLYERCGTRPAGSCILHVGTNSGSARSALLGGGTRLGRNHPTNGGPGACLVECNTLACIQTANLDDYRVLYVASSEAQTSGGLSQSQLDALNARGPEIIDWMNNRGGRIFALSEASMRNAYAWLPRPLTAVDFTFCTPSNARRAADDRIPGTRAIDNEFPGNGVAGASCPVAAGLRVVVSIGSGPRAATCPLALRPHRSSRIEA